MTSPGFPLDGPVPDPPPGEGSQAFARALFETARRENMTLRDLYNLTAAARGHWVLCGTPKRIADTLEEWFVEEAADGFNILPPYFPGALADFVDLVVPELPGPRLVPARVPGDDVTRPFRARAHACAWDEPPPRRLAPARLTQEGTSMDVHVIRHPLVEDVLAALRDRHTPSDAFRQLARRVSLLVAAEATRDLPLAEATVETPLEEATVRRLAARVVAVPVLRAGLGMLGAFLELVPQAQVGYFGLERDETTAVARRYYEKVPKDLAAPWSSCSTPCWRPAARRRWPSRASPVWAPAASGSCRSWPRPKASAQLTRRSRTPASTPRRSTASSTPGSSSFPA